MIPEDSTLRRHYLTEEKYRLERQGELRVLVEHQGSVRLKTVLTDLVIFTVILFIFYSLTLLLVYSII